MEIVNRRVSYEYEIQETFEVGIVLGGSEAKSLRLGQAKLDGAFVKYIGGEFFLVGATIAPYAYSHSKPEDPKRTRKLLLHKKQILHLYEKMKTNRLAIVPLKWYTTGHIWKVLIALARGKKQFEKRAKLKQRALNRELEQQFRGKVR